MEQAASKSSTVVTYGLYLGIAAIVFSLITFYSGMMGNTYFNFLSFILPIVFIFLGLKFYKEKENAGILRYGQGVGLGVLISLVGGAISAVFTYVFYTFIDPAKHVEFLAMLQEKQLEAGMPAEQLEKMDGIMSVMTSPPVQSVFMVINAVFAGLIIALIISAILKKDPEVTY